MSRWSDRPLPLVWTPLMGGGVVGGMVLVAVAGDLTAVPVAIVITVLGVASAILAAVAIFRPAVAPALIAASRMCHRGG